MTRPPAAKAQPSGAINSAPLRSKTPDMRASLSETAVLTRLKGEKAVPSTTEFRKSRLPSIRAEWASRPGTRLPEITSVCVVAPRRSTDSSNQQSSSQRD
ncbi:hypothetical protein Scani_20570 [Streptomyces caniferus]|uniref:Uncharacterized protein n=1 Tax=Streptomyces caniferus TaxID=285557 RepID=A0A640S3P2_9ACTN|nr:hypothetical protein Scani_20570 [Streptomyces caniferus]